MTWEDAYALCGICPDAIRMDRVISTVPTLKRPGNRVPARQAPILTPEPVYDKTRLGHRPEYVVVGGERRGPDWVPTDGTARQQFDKLRAEYARIPRGRRTEYELREVIRDWQRQQTKGKEA